MRRKMIAEDNAFTMRFALIVFAIPALMLIAEAENTVFLNMKNVSNIMFKQYS